MDAMTIRDAKIARCLLLDHRINTGIKVIRTEDQKVIGLHVVTTGEHRSILFTSLNEVNEFVSMISAMNLLGMGH